MRKQVNRGDKKYDKTMRESFEDPGLLLLDHFFPGLKLAATPLPNTMRQHVKEQEADTILKIQVEGGDEFIFHLEFQRKNDKSMARRMASYDFMLHLKYNLNVIGVVVYIGDAPVKMNDTVTFNTNFYHCDVIDIKTIDAELFLQSDKARETIFAILGSYEAGNSRIIIQKIIARLHELLPQSPVELKERIKELEILARLRGEIIQQQILQEEKKMIIEYDLTKDIRYKQGRTEGSTQASLQIAKRLLKKGYDISLISEVTRIPGSSLSKLKKGARGKN